MPKAAVGVMSSLALKMVEGLQAVGWGQPLEAGKGKKADSLLVPLGGLFEFSPTLLLAYRTQR